MVGWERRMWKRCLEGILECFGTLKNCNSNSQQLKMMCNNFLIY